MRSRRGSVSVVSRLSTNPTCKLHGNPSTRPNRGHVGHDKSAPVRGEVIKVVWAGEGTPTRLLVLTQRSAIREWSKTRNDHWDVRVLAGSREYDLVAAALDL